MNMNNDMVRTTIVLDTSTRDKLKQYGVKGDSYEDIILKLMKHYDGKGNKIK